MENYIIVNNKLKSESFYHVLQLTNISLWLFICYSMNKGEGGNIIVFKCSRVLGHWIHVPNSDLLLGNVTVNSVNN